MNRNDCVAYIGDSFTIEWYFDINGDSQPYAFYQELSNSQKRKLFLLLKRIGDFGRIMDKTKFRNEGDGIFAFKPQPDRFLSFFTKDKKIIITNGFLKKSDKLPKRIKDQSIKAKDDYFLRFEEGTYYE